MSPPSYSHPNLQQRLELIPLKMPTSLFNADELNIVDAELAVRTKGFADIHIAAAVEGSDMSEKAAAVSGE